MMYGAMGPVKAFTTEALFTERVRGSPRPPPSGPQRIGNISGADDRRRPVRAGQAASLYSWTMPVPARNAVEKRLPPRVVKEFGRRELVNITTLVLVAEPTVEVQASG